MAIGVRRLNLVAEAEVEREVVGRPPVVLDVLAEQMVRNQRIVDGSDVGFVHHAEQHFGYAVAAGDARATQRIRPGSEAAVELHRCLVVVVLAVHLLHAGHAEVQRVLAAQLDEVGRRVPIGPWLVTACWSLPPGPNDDSLPTSTIGNNGLLDETYAGRPSCPDGSKPKDWLSDVSCQS